MIVIHPALAQFHIVRLVSEAREGRAAANANQACMKARRCCPPPPSRVSTLEGGGQQRAQCPDVGGQVLDNLRTVSDLEGMRTWRR